MAHRFVRHVHERVLRAGEFEAMLDRVAARETDPYTVVDEIVARATARAGAGAELRQG
jgi:hypothetical protein